MYDYSFNIPNEPRAQEHSVWAGELNLKAGEGLKVGEFNLEASEADTKAGDQDIEAGEADTEAGDQDIEAENSNIPPTSVLNPEKTYQDYHLELNGTHLIILSLSCFLFFY